MSEIVVNRPITYATAEQAKAYVTAVQRRPVAHLTDRSAYVITHPGKSAEPMIPVAARLMPGVRLVRYGMIFPGAPVPDAAERAEEIERKCTGAIVLPSRQGSKGAFRFLLGHAATTEANALASMGVPVLVLGPGGLIAWPDAGRPGILSVGPGQPSRTVLELPARPPDVRLLPTLLVSLRVLGIAPPVTVPAPVKFAPAGR